MNIRYGKIVIRYSLQWLFGDEDKIEVPSCVLMFAAARQVIEGSRLLHRCVSVSLAKRAGNWEGKTRSHTAWNMSCWLSDWVLSWAVKNKQDIRTIWMQFLCVPCAEKKHAWRWLLLTQHKFPLSLLTTSFWISDVMCWVTSTWRKTKGQPSCFISGMPSCWYNLTKLRYSWRIRSTTLRGCLAGFTDVRRLPVTKDSLYICHHVSEQATICRNCACSAKDSKLRLL